MGRDAGAIGGWWGWIGEDGLDGGAEDHPVGWGEAERHGAGLGHRGEAAARGRRRRG
jgi:hypothetical protein